MSDYTSDEAEPIPKPKRRRKLRLLGNISLISSDEDNNVKPNKKKKSAKASSIIDLLTSDEEDKQKTKKNAKKTPEKRQIVTLENVFSSDNSEDYSPPTKKSKCTAVPKAKKQPSTSKNPRKKPATTKNTTTVDINTQWEESELLASKCGIDQEVAENLIKLLEEGNTVPFIARYRKNVTKNMSPDEIRQAKESFDDICKVKEKMISVAKAIKQAGKLDDLLQGKISCARTIEELEHIYAPYKPESKGTLAGRAIKLGLDKPAHMILNNTAQEVNLHNFVNVSVKGLETFEAVQDGVMHIISSEMAVDTEVLNFVRDMRQKSSFSLTSVEKKASKNETKIPKTNTTAKVDNEKYEIYFNKSFAVRHLKSYQILAINRGEAQKALTVKIEIPEYFNDRYRHFSSRKWKIYAGGRGKILSMAMEHSLTKYIQPLVIRQIRTELTNKAHRQSTEIFSTNLKHLLMAPPWKGKHILGMDPGFRNGIKLAMISPTGKFLESDVLYPYNRGPINEDIFKKLLFKYECETLGIGNGHACRQTEEWVAGLIKKRMFGKLNVKYTIVTEDGASIYSCSAEAKKEFGNLDPNIIGAVSLARRLQDPLAELVKVEPNHLGIGMYQLDIKKKELEDALNEVVSECVSFVGVDLNTASQCLLKRVAGLSDKKAELIINYRESHGPFTHRRQLVDVYGIGEKCFQQCAGFLKIAPLDPNDKQKFYSKKNTTALDSTIIHPESYKIAKQIIQQAGLRERDIGSEDFVTTFTSKKQSFDVDKLVETLDTSKETLHLVFDALSRKSSYDLREEAGAAPLFKQNITEFSSLTPGMTLTGRIVNVVEFGAFADVGVEQSGLIHVSKMNNMILNIGDRVEVVVLSIDVGKKRLSLEAVAKL